MEQQPAHQEPAPHVAAQQEAGQQDLQPSHQDEPAPEEWVIGEVGHGGGDVDHASRG